MTNKELEQVKELTRKACIDAGGTESSVLFEKWWQDNSKEFVGRVNQMECVPGCTSYDGGEKKHHKDCPYYPDSFTKRYDDLKKTLEGKARDLVL